jgi:hypothetical protein
LLDNAWQYHQTVSQLNFGRARNLTVLQSRGVLLPSSPMSVPNPEGAGSDMPSDYARISYKPIRATELSQPAWNNLLRYSTPARGAARRPEETLLIE